MHAHTHACTYTCMHLHMHALTHACTYTYMHVHMYIHMHTHTYFVTKTGEVFSFTVVLSVLI